MQAMWEIDVTAAEALSRLARANRPLREKLERIRLADQLGSAGYFPSVHADVKAFQLEHSERPS